jgi:hypothetical protein
MRRGTGMTQGSFRPCVNMDLIAARSGGYTSCRDAILALMEPKRSGGLRARQELRSPASGYARIACLRSSGTVLDPTQAPLLPFHGIGGRMTPWGGVPCPFGGMGFGGFSSQCGMRVPAERLWRSEVRGKLSHLDLVEAWELTDPGVISPASPRGGLT